MMRKHGIMRKNYQIMKKARNDEKRKGKREEERNDK